MVIVSCNFLLGGGSLLASNLLSEFLQFGNVGFDNGKGACSAIVHVRSIDMHLQPTIPTDEPMI